MKINLSSFVAGASLTLLCSVSTVALADGMPFAETKPKPNLAPLDKAIDAQVKTDAAEAPPVTMTQPEEEEPAPVAEAPQPQPPVAPAPEERTVDVQPNTSFFGLSVGTYNRFSHGERNTAFNLEWQPGVKILGRLQPIFGAMATTKGSMLGYGGIGVPFNVTDRIFLMPSVAVGGYKKGDGYDLDSSLVYRAGTELAYQFDDKSRLGLNYHVLTNGKSMSREDRAEIVMLTYTMPFDMFSKSSSSSPLNAQLQAPALNTQALAEPQPASAQSAALIMPAAGTSYEKPLPDVLP